MTSTNSVHARSLMLAATVGLFTALPGPAFVSGMPTAQAGVLDTIVDAGRAVGGHIKDTGQAIGREAKGTGKIVGKFAKDAATSAGSGLKSIGKGIAKGAAYVPCKIAGSCEFKAQGGIKLPRADRVPARPGRNPDADRVPSRPGMARADRTSARHGVQRLNRAGPRVRSFGNERSGRRR